MALNPTGLLFKVTATNAATAPDTPSEVSWALSGPRADGADIVVFSTYPRATQVQRQIDNGSWVAIGSTPGVYPITGLSVETAYSIKLRAVNSIGASSASVAKPLFTIPVDPRGFRGWSPTIDLGTTGDIFVAPYGNDTTGTGTIGAPYATLTRALTAATTGQKIKMRAGTYREKCTISTASVKIEGYGAEKPTITAADALTGWTQCSAADAAVIGPTLGVAGSPVYKKTISKTGWDYTDVTAMNFYEAGRRVFMASDRADTSQDMFAPNSATFWEADSFTLNGSNQITAITDASVINSSRYTQSELEAARVMVYHSPNIVSYADIVTADLGANTITINGNLPTTEAYARLFAIQNVARGLKSGTVFVAENGTDATIYIYPYSAANLDLVEFSPRDNVLLFGAVSGIELRGLALMQATGKITDKGSNILKQDEGVSARSGFIIEHCLTGRIENVGQTPRAIYLKHTEDSAVRNCSFWECPGRGVFYSANSQTYPGARNSVEKSHFEKIGGAGFLCYTQDDMVFAHNYSHRIGITDHANLTNAYQRSLGVLWWGNEFTDQCLGYLTWQAASHIVVAFNWIPQKSKAQNDNRSIVDQNVVTSFPPPVSNGWGYIFNNSSHPDPASSYVAGTAIRLTANGTDTVYTVVNNVAYAITDATDTPVAPAQIGYNVITKLDPATSQTTGSFDGTNVIQTNLALVYTNAAAGDFSPVSGSPILTTAGQSMASTVTTLAARFTQFTGWDKDFKDQTINWANLPMGADAGLAWVR